MSINKPSRAWPFIKRLAKLVCGFGEKALAGSSAGVQFLIDVQDDLAKSGDETQKGIKEALQEIRANTAATIQLLAAEQLTVTDEQLRTAAKEVAEALYLRRVADDYVYADFKGIEQQERIASLKLDEIFVDLKAVAERGLTSSLKIAEPFRSFVTVPIQMMNGDVLGVVHFERGNETNIDQDARTAALESIAANVGKFVSSIDSNIVVNVGEEEEVIRDIRAKPQPIDHIISRSGGTVLMGGPGSGKTTLVKRLARSCALGADELKQRYPQLPWCFPIVLPITTFQTDRGERDLFRFLRDRLIELGGETLDEVFVERWAAGQCLVLLDGLDEVADVAGRIAAARGVDELLQTGNGNRVVVTTRPVGYNITRLSVPAEHYLLEPFSPQEIAKFVRQWYLAHDRAMRPETPNPQQAEADAQSLIDDVQKNSGVGTLATNPLMLTIIALIKHQNVVLPERRVELYEIALNTLLRSWNRARSLSKRPVGEEPKLEKTKKVWAAVAYWMHANVSRTISEAKLHERLVEVLMQEFHEPQHQADDIATSYLEAAKDRSGLLEARGPSTFAFVHQTFQEYLAAIHLALPTRKAVEKILAHAQDPRWHEAIRLAAGYIVIHQTDYDTLRDLMNALLDESDPLEPYLGTSLRLAAACISDDIGVQTAESDRVLVKIFEHLTEPCYEPLAEAILKVLPTLQVVPGESAVGALCHATKYSDWHTQMEATRLLARLSVPAAPVLQTLQRLFERERNTFVKAHAAWGLWQSNQRRDRAVALAVIGGMTSGHGHLKLEQEPTFLTVLLELLKDGDASVRLCAAEVLGSWGYQAPALTEFVALLQNSEWLVRSLAADKLRRSEPLPQAVAALIELLNDADSDIRMLATNVLGDWGYFANAIPTLFELAEEENSSIRGRAVSVLGQWSFQASAVPMLANLLKDVDRTVRSLAATVLGRWGCEAQVIPFLIETLNDADIYTRLDAAKMLGERGHHNRSVPVLIDLLHNRDRFVRADAASLLTNWGYEALAIPVLVELLKDVDSEVRSHAAEKLGGVTDPVQGVSELIESLKDSDTGVVSSAALAIADWAKNNAIVNQVVAKLFRPKGDAVVVAEFLLSAANGGTKQRSAKINQLLAKGLKPNGRDSDERRALRQILFRWTWDALATTA